MDANNRLIPIVEDDQGEGVKDPLVSPSDELIDLYKEMNKEYEKRAQKVFGRKERSIHRP